MVQAVIFDCFGVLTTEGWLSFKRKHFGHDATLMDQATDIRKQADSGLIGHNDFVRQIAVQAQVNEDEVRHSVEGNASNAELFEYIRTELKPKYKIGMLSNTGRDVLTELFKANDARLFDATAMSYETGVTKPHPMAYQAIAGTLGVEVAECVLVDDQQSYCQGAREAGMQAIQYQDFDQFRRELETILAAGGSGNPKH